jgi:hypothetical protein
MTVRAVRIALSKPLDGYRLNRKAGIAPFGALERFGNVAETASAGVPPVGAASADLDCPLRIVTARPVTDEPLTAACVIHGHSLRGPGSPTATDAARATAHNMRIELADMPGHRLIGVRGCTAALELAGDTSGD